MVGSSLLAIMDDYAFNHFELEDSFVSENIGNSNYFNMILLLVNTQLCMCVYIL